jgi:hypothetical protein
MQRDLEADLRLCEAASPKEEWAKDRIALTVSGRDRDDRETVVVLFDDNDWCAEFHDNLGMGCGAEDYANFFAAAREGWPYAIRKALEMQNALRSIATDAAVFNEQQKEIERLRQELSQANAEVLSLEKNLDSLPRPIGWRKQDEA